MSYDIYEDRDYNLVITTDNSLAGATELEYAISVSAAQPILINKTLAAGDIVLDNDNQITITIDSADTKDMTGQFYHEAKVVYADNLESTISIAEQLYIKRALIE
jgi:hypothetical protein